jgi:uncharacterized membrane protein
MDPVTSDLPSSQQNTGMALISYLGILFIVPLLTDAKNDPFVKFHIKQGLTLFLMEMTLVFVAAVPFIGFLLALFAGPVSLLFTILGIINAATGKTKELPLIGSLAKNFNF